MKIERLLAIIVYLLNHGRISASTLAQRFEVSIRTTQRDMEAITSRKGTCSESGCFSLIQIA